MYQNIIFQKALTDKHLSFKALSCSFSFGSFKLIRRLPGQWKCFVFLTWKRGILCLVIWYLRTQFAEIFSISFLMLVIQEKPTGSFNTTPEIPGKGSFFFSFFFCVPEEEKALSKNRDTLPFSSCSFYVISLDLATVVSMVWWVRRCDCWSQLSDFVDS